MQVGATWEAITCPITYTYLVCLPSSFPLRAEGSNSHHLLLTGSIPHEWLFAENRVAAVVHHGGAGTTAIGLRNGLPTVIVPFFGDQPWQGDMVANAGAGPMPYVGSDHALP